MHCLVVIAHPVPDSLCRAMAQKAMETLRTAGHTVLVEDLYTNSFPPALTLDERLSYYSPEYDLASVQPQIEHLLNAEGLVLCFPTWWFGFPAILKGWFDRIWVPGIAYDHASDLGAIKPKLAGLRRVLAITSLGAPWWVDRLVMHQPVKRVLKTAILGACVPHCRFQMLSIYKAEKLDESRVKRFSSNIERALASWA